MSSRNPDVSTTCPPERELRAFLSGALTEDIRFTQIAAHLESCDICQRQLASASTFLDVERQEAPDQYESEPECARTIALVEALPRRRSGPPLPETIGHYRILDVLGHGGMGVAYKAWHEHLKRVVVLKLIGHDFAGSTVCKSQFAVEQEAIGRVSHPNVATAYDAGVHQGMPFLVLEYVEGVSLQELLRQQEHFSIARACEIGRDIALGLQAIHTAGFVHCDIKPSNVVVTATGQVKILDFGLAREPSRIQQSVSAPFGTRFFQPQEQTLPGGQINFRSDLYSLGVTLYCLLSGKFPSATSATGGGLDPTTLQTSRSDLPAELIPLLTELLSINPETRPESAATVAEVLDRCRTSQICQPSPGADAPPSRSSKLALSGVAAAVFVLWMVSQAAMRMSATTAPLEPGTNVAVPKVSATNPATQNLPASPPSALPSSVASRSSVSHPWKPGSQHGQISGFAYAPTRLPGVIRWQMDTRQPRSGVRAIAWDPAERRLACVSDDGQVRIYERSAGRLRFSHMLPCNGASTPQFRSLGWDPAGQSLLAANSHPRSEVDLWDVAGRKRLLELKAHPSGNTCVSWSPDLQMFASAGLDGHVRVWTTSGELQGEFSSHQGAVHAVAWNPRRNVVASAGEDGTVRIWDVGSKQEIANWVAHDSAIRHIAWHPAGDRLVSCNDKSAIIWNVASESGQHPTSTELQPSPRGARFAAWRNDGQYLAVAGLDIRVWNADYSQSQLVAPANGEWLEAISWGPTTGQLTFAPANGSIQSWDPETRTTTQLHHRVRLQIGDLQWSPDSQLLAVQTDRGRVTVFDTEGHRKTAVGSPLEVSCTTRFAWHPSSKSVAIAIDYPRPTVQIWSLSDGRKERSISSASAVISLEYVLDGRRLLTIHADGCVQAMDLATQAAPITLYKHPTPLVTADFCHKRHRLALGDETGVVAIVELNEELSKSISGVRQFTLSNHPVMALAWNNLGSILAAGDYQILCLRDVSKDSNLFYTKDWPPHGTLSWTANDERLVVGSIGGVDAAKFHFKPPTKLWLRAATSADGKHIADAHVHGMARVRTMSAYTQKWAVALINADLAIGVTNAGEFLDDSGDPQELIYVVESPRNTFQTLTPEGFRKTHIAQDKQSR